jgi:hypothetical protein
VGNNLYVRNGINIGSGGILTNGLLSVSGSGNNYFAGNVGIGTTNPSTLLDVAGEASISGNLTIGYNSSVRSAYGDLQFAYKSAPNAWTVGAKLQQITGSFIAQNLLDLNNSTYGIDPAGATLNENTSSLYIYYGAIMGMDSTNGKVGIGITNPASKLAVSGNAAIGSEFATSTAPANGLVIQGNVGIGTTAPEARLTVHEGTNSVWAAVISGGGGNSYGLKIRSAANTSDPAFAVFDNYETEKFRIQSNGKVGIGITSPSTTLHVYSTGGDRTAITVRDSDGSCTGNPESGSFGWSCSSDARLKTNITDTKPLLSKLMEIKIRDYTLISSGEKATGVIAQELQTIFPELVNMGQDGYLVVSEPSNWILIKGIQEQQTQINTLGQQISRLQSSLSTQLANLSLTSTGDLNIAQTQSGEYQVKNNQTGDIITRLSTFSEIVIGKIKAGLLEAEKIVVNNTLVAKNIVTENINLTTPNLTIAGKTLEKLIDERVQIIFNSNLLSLSSQKVVSPVVETGEIQLKTQNSKLKTTTENAKLSIIDKNEKPVAEFDMQNQQTSIFGSLEIKMVRKRVS